jgi:large subunit ribosomal protein L9
MEVILKEDVANLGHRGDVVKVADGYGRNFLLPRKLALQATLANKAVIEQMKAAAARRSATEKAQAEELVAKLEPVVLSFTRKSGEAGHLFGSVTSADIAAALEAKGFESIAARFSWTSRSRAWATSPWPSSCTAKSPRT